MKLVKILSSTYNLLFFSFWALIFYFTGRKKDLYICWEKKMWRWRGKTFKEYIREEIANFTVGISGDMKTRFNFVNVAGGAYHDITDSVIVMDYQNAAAA